MGRFLKRLVPGPVVLPFNNKIQKQTNKQASRSAYLILERTYHGIKARQISLGALKYNSQPPNSKQMPYYDVNKPYNC